MWWREPVHLIHAVFIGLTGIILLLISNSYAGQRSVANIFCACTNYWVHNRKKSFCFLTSQGSVPSMAHILHRTFLSVNRDALCIRNWSLHWILMYQALLLIMYVKRYVCSSARVCMWVLVRFFFLYFVKYSLHRTYLWNNIIRVLCCVQSSYIKIFFLENCFQFGTSLGMVFDYTDQN